MSKRKALSTKTRFDVFKRDSFQCQYCGSHPPQAVLHVDHVIAVAEGGGNDSDNLVTACDRCNMGKGARPLTDIPPTLKDKAAQVAEREAQIRGYSEVMAHARQRIDDEVWDVATAYIEHFHDDGIRKDYLHSIRNFIEKLGVHECIRAMELALARKPWSKNTAFKYFCGICWRLVRESEADG